MNRFLPRLLLLSKQKKNILLEMPLRNCTFGQKKQEIREMMVYNEQLRPENPIKRTGKIFKNDMKFLWYKVKKSVGFEEELSSELQAQSFPTHTDVLVLGSGPYASSIAFWLKKRAPQGLNVIIVENSVKNIFPRPFNWLTQQFALPENVAMTIFGADFLRDIEKECAIDGMQFCNANYTPSGFLYLADEEGGQKMKTNVKVQQELGVRNVVLSTRQLKDRFPWLNLKGIEFGVLGLDSQGFFDPDALQDVLKIKSINLGAEFVEGEVLGFEFKHQPNIMAPSKGEPYEQLERLVVKLPNGEVHGIKFGYCVLADELEGSKIAKMCRIGQGDGLLSVPLPIETMKKFVYSAKSNKISVPNAPAVVNPNGAFFGCGGFGNMIAGTISSQKNSLDAQNFFERDVKPFLNQRIGEYPCTKQNIPYYYEYNSMDENGIIGMHPYYHNLLLATGFSGHGAQHAPAVGRAVMELLLDGEYKTINLSRLGFERICLGEPLIQ